MNRRYKKESKIKQIIFSHINNNIKSYIIISSIFVLGVVLGVIFTNNVSDNQEIDINNHISSLIDSVKKNSNNINNIILLKDSINQNCILAMLLWIMGSTVIGIIVVYFIIGFRGFCLGYTISSIIATFGAWKGIIIALTTMFLQNIIFIPCIISLGVSGIRLCNSIMKDRRKENIKGEILRHSIFCLFVLLLLIISSIIEVYISKNLLILFLKYI